MFFTVSRKIVIEDFFFLRKEKDASSEQILKNLLGRDHSGFLFTFFFF